MLDSEQQAQAAIWPGATKRRAAADWPKLVGPGCTIAPTTRALRPPACGTSRRKQHMPCVPRSKAVSCSRKMPCCHHTCDSRQHMIPSHHACGSSRTPDLASPCCQLTRGCCPDPWCSDWVGAALRMCRHRLRNRARHQHMHSQLLCSCLGCTTRLRHSRGWQHHSRQRQRLYSGRRTWWVARPWSCGQTARWCPLGAKLRPWGSQDPTWTLQCWE